MGQKHFFPKNLKETRNDLMDTNKHHSHTIMFTGDNR